VQPLAFRWRIIALKSKIVLNSYSPFLIQPFKEVNHSLNLATGGWPLVAGLFLLTRGCYIPVIGTQGTKSAIHLKNFGPSDQRPETRSQ
jgi:hypothetical protein